VLAAMTDYTNSGMGKMADMYHSSDPEIEAATHRIRKQFHDTIREIEQQGQQLDNVEAFLISSNDLYEVQKMFHRSNGGADPDGQMRMYGVKIIESQYIPDGMIFKVFKNDHQQPFFSPGIHAIPISGSGVIPNRGLSKEQIEDTMLPVTTTIDVDDITTVDIKENMEKAIEAVNKVIDEPIPKGYVSQKKKRHSKKRRIELDK